MQKKYLDIGKVFLLLFGLLSGLPSFGQALRTSPFQYQFNQLSLNPAYASRLPYPGFEATYFGNFTSANQVSRSVILNAQGPTAAGGVGGTLQFYRTFSFGELNVRPAYAINFSLPNGGELSFGAAIGLNYFDIDESVLSNLQSDFISADAGAGVFYHQKRFFVGLSVLNLIELSSGISKDNITSSFLRENPYNLHMGTTFRLMEDIDLKPSMLLRYINIYELPDQSFGSISQDLSYDFQLSAFVQDIYVISILYGKTDVEFGQGLERFGIAATYLLGNFRLSYAIQLNNQSNSNISLPASHLLSAGYDLFNDGEEEVIRFF